MEKYKIEIKWGLIFVVITLIWMVLERLFGFHDSNIEVHAIVTNFFAIPAIAIYVLALLDKKKNYYDGIMSYGQGFVSGVIITVIVTVLSPLTQYLTVEVISPGYFDNISAYAVQAGQMTQAQAESYFNLQSYMIQSLISTPIMGVVTTARIFYQIQK